MSYDQLSRDYGPRDPFQQYHGQPEAEQQRMDHMIEERKRAYARGMQADQIYGNGVIPGANRVVGPDVMKEPNISVNAERMDKILSHQEELLTMLEQRMTPFVRAYPKQSREEDAKTASCQSALSERLYIQTQRADFICTRINALIESIDL